MERHNNLPIHILAMVFAGILIVASSGFLKDHEVLTGAILLLFAGCYAAASFLLKEARYLFPTMILGAGAYFLFLSAAGISSIWFPAFAVPLASALLCGAKFAQVRKKEDYRRVQTTGAELTVLLFTLLVLLRASTYAVEFPVAAWVALTGFAAIGYVKHMRDGTPSSLGVFFFSVAAGVMFIGPPLVGRFWSRHLLLLVAAGLLSGAVKIHSMGKTREAGYGYYAGVIVLFTACVTATERLEVLAPVLTVAVTLLLGMRLQALRMLRIYEGVIEGGRAAVASFSVCATIAALAMFVSFIGAGFPGSKELILSSLVVSIAFFLSALLDGRAVLKRKDGRIYASALFFCLACLCAISWKAPQSRIDRWLIPAVFPPVCFLMLWRITHKWHAVSQAALDASWLSSIVVCLVSLAMGACASTQGLVLPAALFACFSTGFALTRREGTFAGMVVSISYGYYCVAGQMSVFEGYPGGALVPLGLLLLAAAYVLDRMNRNVARRAN